MPSRAHRREGIDTVLVYGMVDSAVIDGSIRTVSRIVDPDRWMKEMFGQSRDGKYYGGGRRGKDGFQIPQGIFAKSNDKDLVWRLAQDTIENLLFEKLGIERRAVNGKTDAKTNGD